MFITVEKPFKKATIWELSRPRSFTRSEVRIIWSQKLPGVVISHGSLELSQLGKNVSGVWRVLYDARGTPEHHQLGEEIYRWENFEKITIIFFQIWAKKGQNWRTWKNDEKKWKNCQKSVQNHWIRSPKLCFIVSEPKMIHVIPQVSRKWSKMAQKGEKWHFSPHPLG